MIEQTELDFVRGRYPRTPGAKEKDGASEQAARSMVGRAVTLRALVVEALESGPMTADEVAAALHESILAVRPRLSELCNLGRIVKTEARRPNRSGKMATVWAVEGKEGATK